MLFCESLKKIANRDDWECDMLDTQGMDGEQLSFLGAVDEKPELLLHWVQRLVIQNVESGVVTAASPIVSRVFQELSNDIVSVNDAKRLDNIPFPFPYAQLLSLILLLHGLLM